MGNCNNRIEIFGKGLANEIFQDDPLNDPPYVTSSGPLSGTNVNHGGPFKATFQDGPFSNQYFPTVCLEYTENFQIGGVYMVTIEPSAIFGGGGAVNGQDPVSPATQLLYRTFLTGGLDALGLGFDYSQQSSYIAVQTVSGRTTRHISRQTRSRAS